jgi:hypothetical protein
MASMQYGASLARFSNGVSESRHKAKSTWPTFGMF